MNGNKLENKDDFKLFKESRLENTLWFKNFSIK